MVMEAKFYVDFCFEAGSEEGFLAHVGSHYQFGIKLSEEEYEELYQVWYKNNSSLNSWESDWTEHDALFGKLNNAAVKALKMLLEAEESGIKEPLDVLWEISKETEKEF
jgi:hypothetical protein